MSSAVKTVDVVGVVGEDVARADRGTVRVQVKGTGRGAISVVVEGAVRVVVKDAEAVEEPAETGDPLAQDPGEVAEIGD